MSNTPRKVVFGKLVSVDGPMVATRVANREGARVEVCEQIDHSESTGASARIPDTYRKSSRGLRPGSLSGPHRGQGV